MAMRAPPIDCVVNRTYSGTGQRTTYVYWRDGARTEFPTDNPGTHAQALLARAKQLGRPVTDETW